MNISLYQLFGHVTLRFSLATVCFQFDVYEHGREIKVLMPNIYTSCNGHEERRKEKTISLIFIIFHSLLFLFLQIYPPVVAGSPDKQRAPANPVIKRMQALAVIE